MVNTRHRSEDDYGPSKSMAIWETVLHRESACMKCDWQAALAQEFSLQISAEKLCFCSEAQRKAIRRER
jgi:hypothetical protein